MTLKVELSPRRIGLAVLAGAALAAALAALQWLVGALRLFGPQMVASFALQAVGLVFVRAFANWFFGLLLIGAPGWWLLHRHGFRGWRVAIVAGMALTFLTVLVLAIPLPGQASEPPSVVASGSAIVHHWVVRQTWQSVVTVAFLTSFVGGAVGGLMWRIAYRRQGA
jgi:hypothetical protein